jgi:hypothetical protein
MTGGIIHSTGLTQPHALRLREGWSLLAALLHLSTVLLGLICWLIELQTLPACQLPIMQALQHLRRYAGVVEQHHMLCALSFIANRGATFWSTTIMMFVIFVIVSTLAIPQRWGLLNLRGPVGGIIPDDMQLDAG